MVVLPVLPCFQLLRQQEHKRLCIPSLGPRRAPSARSGWSWSGSTPAGSSLHPEALRKHKYRHFSTFPPLLYFDTVQRFWYLSIGVLLVLPSPEMSLLTPVGYTAATLTVYGVSGSSFCRMTLVFFPPTCVCSQETCQWLDSLAETQLHFRATEQFIKAD